MRQYNDTESDNHITECTTTVLFLQMLNGNIITIEIRKSNSICYFVLHILYTLPIFIFLNSIINLYII